MMQKKNGTIVACWKQLTVCWPQTVGAPVRKHSINQTMWLNWTCSQLAYTEIRIDNAHNVLILHSRDVGRTLLPLLTSPLLYLTLLSTLHRTRSRLNVGTVPFGPRTCICVSSHLVSNPHMMQINDQQHTDNDILMRTAAPELSDASGAQTKFQHGIQLQSWIIHWQPRTDQL